MFSIRRIRAIMMQEMFLLYRSGEVIADIVVFPLAHIAVFGFISLYLSEQNTQTAYLVLLGMLLWQINWIVQYSVTLGSLWNIWSRNLTNLFVSPLNLLEYIFAHTLSGVIKSALIIGLAAVFSFYLFDFNLLSIGMLSLVLTFINLVMFSYAMGIAILGLIFRYGTRIQAAAWGTSSLLQPLVAAFYPVSVMPTILQYISALFPATYIFEAARHSLEHGTIAWELIGFAFLMNILYCVWCTRFFVRMYNTSRETGQFSRNEA